MVFFKPTKYRLLEPTIWVNMLKKVWGKFYHMWVFPLGLDCLNLCKRFKPYPSPILIEPLNNKLEGLTGLQWPNLHVIAIMQTFKTNKKP